MQKTLLFITYLISLISCMNIYNDLYPFDTDHSIKRSFSKSIDLYTTKQSDTTHSNSPITARIMISYFNGQYTPVQVAWVNDPLKYFSIVEPGVPLGCRAIFPRSRVSHTSTVNNCSIAGNAGFFNVTSDDCIGNLIANGVVVQIPGRQNANFGIRENGEIVTGYLSEMTIRNGSFVNLVSGVIWLVKDGRNFVDESFDLEDMSAQATGRDFVTVHSARSAIGHDSFGRVVMVNVQGKSWERGVGLNQFADFLIDLGIINAINLDGGGSMTSVRENVMISAPSDDCQFDRMFKCEREVSSAVCLKGKIKIE